MSQWYHRLFAATPANGAGMKTYALVDRHFVAENPIQYSAIQYPITSPLLGTDWTVNALLRLRSVGTYDPHSLWNDWYFVNFEPFGSPKLAGIIANRIAMPSAATTVRDFFFSQIFVPVLIPLAYEAMPLLIMAWDQQSRDVPQSLSYLVWWRLLGDAISC